MTAAAMRSLSHRRCVELLWTHARARGIVRQILTIPRKSVRKPPLTTAGLAARTSRRGKVGLQEVEEAGKEVEEVLLDVVEGGVAEGRPQ